MKIIKWWYLICVMMLAVSCAVSKQSAPQSIPPLSLPNIISSDLIVTNKFKPSGLRVYTRLKYWNYTSNPVNVSNSFDLKNWNYFTTIQPYQFAMVIRTNKQEFFKLSH